jgi:predicted sulfurtransferase
MRELVNGLQPLTAKTRNKNNINNMTIAISMITMKSSDRSTAHQDNVLLHDDYRIALYYCYTDIRDVNEHVDFQGRLCQELDLNGRIRVSTEGLNGVLSGLKSNLKSYQERTEEELIIKNLDVKYCLLRTDISVESQLFDSLSVKPTREVVSLYETTPQETERSQKIVDETNPKYFRRRRRNRQKHEHQHKASAPSVPNSPLDERLTRFKPSPHLTPEEWNHQLVMNTANAVLVDARNVYESRVGYFHVEGVPTLLTNTRKFSSLPQVLQESKQALAGKTVYMYCTGGVRCERASVFLQALAASNEEWGRLEPPKAIYQLEGGIQQYLERYGSSDVLQANYSMPNSDCLFRGKNFVFDPRRTDPLVGRDGVVGRCLLCSKLHDDYDNGNPPNTNKEARCCKCRILILVCNSCRPTVRIWGEDCSKEKQNLYCGGAVCIDEGNSVEQAVLI